MSEGVSEGVSWSRLVGIELENVMTIVYALVRIDERGILNIAGYNDSGKSAITRMLEVMLYDEYAHIQKSMIHDDKEYMMGRLFFSDGIRITRYKYATGQSVWRMEKEEDLLYTNELSTGIAAVSGVPGPIEQYLAVIRDETTGQKLNARRNTDKLLLTHTSGGDNYKMLNGVLQNDVLAETVRRLNTDRNKLNSEVAVKSNSRDTLVQELAQLEVMDEREIAKLEEGRERLGESRKRFVYLTSVLRQAQTVREVSVPDEVPQVDLTRLNELTRLLELKAQMDQPIPPEVPLVEVGRLTDLRAIGTWHNQSRVVIPPELPIIDTGRWVAVKEVGSRYNTWFNANQEAVKVERAYTDLTTYLKELSDEHGLHTCKTCGAIEQIGGHAH